MKAYVIFAVVLVGGILFFASGIYFLYFTPCANAIISSIHSPNKNWKVVLFERNCGATTGYSSQISLIKSSLELGNETGNIYIAEGYPKGYSIKWKSNAIVKIQGINSNSNKMLKEFNGIQLQYE